MKTCIQQTTNGSGIGTFATEAIKKGELILWTTGRVITKEEYEAHEQPSHCFQIEAHLHLAPDKDYNGIFSVNHSCEPTAAIRNAVGLQALRDIEPGEEITYDYCTTDYHNAGLAYTMRCLCGSRFCRGVISDTDWSAPQLQHQYKGFFSKYLEEIIGQ